MPNYNDKDITFFMGLYQDLGRADGALKRLREHFPEARVIVRSDGDPNPENEALSEQFNVDYRAEERLFPIECGGAMVARTLELYLEQPTAYLFRIDTDTGVYRRFKFLPEQSGVFGSLQKNREKCISIQGGCTGFSKSAIQAIVSSGLLLDPRLQLPEQYLDVSPYFSAMARRGRRRGLSSFDWIIGWVATELQIPMLSFSEVHSRWHPAGNVDNANLEFAMTHPVIS